MWKLSCSLILAAVAGCGAVDPGAGRALAVERSLDVCRDQDPGTTRQEVETLFVIVEADRDEGYTKLDELQYYGGTCNEEFGTGTNLAVSCILCVTSVIDEV